MGHFLHILLKYIARDSLNVKIPPVAWIIVFVIVIHFYHLVLELLLGSARASEQVLHFK